MSASDALIQPIYNCRYREYLTLVDSNGDPVSPSTPDTEISKDGAAFADATNELTEISSGDCYIDFTYDEMAASVVFVRPKSTGAITRSFKLFPQRLPVLRSGTAQAGAAGSITLDSGASAKDGAYTGCWVRAANNTPAGIQGRVRRINGYTGSTKVATVAPNWDTTPTSSTTFEILVPSDMSVSTLLATKAEVATQVSTQLGILKNSAGSGDLFFTMRDSTNHELATGKTVSGQVSKDGAAFAAVAGAISEVANGWYKLAANAGDRNGDMLLFYFTATGCDPTPITIKTGT